MNIYHGEGIYAHISEEGADGATLVIRKEGKIWISRHYPTYHGAKIALGKVLKKEGYRIDRRNSK